jgi:hypothetical protein
LDFATVRLDARTLIDSHRISVKSDSETQTGNSGAQRAKGDK